MKRSEETTLTILLPADVTGATIYRSFPVPTFPWWAPLWLRRRLPWFVLDAIPTGTTKVYYEVGNVKR